MTVLLAVIAFARVTSFTDVKCVYRENPNDQPGKEDGMLHFDPIEKMMSFSSGNNVLVHIRYETVTKITYQPKSGKLMTVYFKDMQRRVALRAVPSRRRKSREHPGHRRVADRPTDSTPVSPAERIILRQRATLDFSP